MIKINLKLMEKLFLKYGLHFARENLKFQTKEELIILLKFFVFSFIQRLNRINN